MSLPTTGPAFSFISSVQLIPILLYSFSKPFSIMTSLVKAVSTVTALAASLANAQATVNNQFRITGNSGVSAQQMFLATPEKVIVVDKTQGNGNDLEINGHPVWGTEYDITTDEYRPMEIVSNSQSL